jgi:tetratricopeptide (TPR) repeat protein
MNKTMKTLPKHILILGIILILTIVVYLPVFKAGFVNLDDNAYVYENQDVINGGIRSVWHFFTQFYVGHFLPLTMLSFKFDYLIFGNHATGFHVVNLILHLLNCVLLFMLIEKLFSNKHLSLIVAALFALHPMHVESVAWISERKDVLYTFFLLISLIYYLRYMTEIRSQRNYIISLIAFFLALLSKSATVILPVLLILIDLQSNEKFNKRIITDKIPFLILSLFFAWLTLFSQDVGGKGSEVFAVFSATDKLMFALYAFGFYILKSFLPLHLSAFHPFPSFGSGQIPDSFYVCSIISVLFFIILIWLVIRSVRLKKSNIVLFGMLVYFICISLYLYLPVGRVVVAERFSYLAYVGLFLIFAYGVYNLMLLYQQKYFTVIFRIVLIFIILTLSFLTYKQSGIWLNGLSLWKNVLNLYPADPVANKSMADAFVTYKNFDQAMFYYKKSISLDTGYAEAYYNMGNMNLKSGKLYQSMDDFSKAVELNPGMVDAYINRGNAKVQLKNFEGAIADYTLAIKNNPTKTEAFINRGSSYFLLKKNKLACADWKIAAEQGSKQATDMLESYCR